MSDLETKFKIRSFNGNDFSKRDVIINGDSWSCFNSSNHNKKIIVPTYHKNYENIQFLTFQRNNDNPNDCIIFSIRGFFKLKNKEDRLFVSIFGNDVLIGACERFLCYASISDGSFWRFCIKDDTEERFDKGYNYVSSTFINIYLQKFIDANRQNYDISILDRENIPCVKTSLITNKNLKKRLLTDSYVSENVFFTMMNKVFPHVVTYDKYKNCLSTLLKELSFYTTSVEQNYNEEIDTYSDLYCLLKDVGLNKSRELTGIESRREFFKNVSNVFSRIFIHNFELKPETKKYIYEKKFNIGYLNFVADILSVEIKYKLTNKIYILYYMIYKLEGTRYKRKTFIHIIPLTNNTVMNQINIFGLDERYVATGVLINKIFDYQSQSPITVLRGHFEESSLNYRFIGDLVNYDFLPDK